MPTVEMVVDIANRTMWITLLLSLPILLTTLVVGVLISLIQTVTSVQEMTLTFVPKLLVSMVVLAFTMSWMNQILIEFTREMWSKFWLVTVDSLLMSYLLFALVLIRCSGLIVFAPFFGADNFPVMARIGMAAIFAMLFYPMAQKTILLPETLDVSALCLLAIQEVMLGLVFGFLASLVFIGAQLAGELAGLQIGFSMANIIDPLMGEEVSIIGFLKMNLAMLLFLLLNMHLGVLWVVWKSFEFIGIGRIGLQGFLVALNDAGLAQAHGMFVVALQLSMPVLLVMLLESVVEGFITRTMPQMNITVFGLPLRLCLGLTVLLFALPLICHALVGSGERWPAGGDGILSRMVDGVYRAMQGFATAH